MPNSVDYPRDPDFPFADEVPLRHMPLASAENPLAFVGPTILVVGAVDQVPNADWMGAMFSMHEPEAQSGLMAFLEGRWHLFWLHTDGVRIGDRTCDPSIRLEDQNQAMMWAVCYLTNINFPAETVGDALEQDIRS